MKHTSTRNRMIFRVTGLGLLSLLAITVLSPSVLAVGSGSFTSHPVTPLFGSGASFAVALGDLDGDGDLDAVVANYNNQAETVWVNDGAGSFTPHPTTPAFGAADSRDVTLGDLDGDGDLDAVVANEIDQVETVWVNDGAGNFTPHPTTPLFGSGWSQAVALGDLDGDGDLDAVVANYIDQPETVWVNDGAGNFTPHPTTPLFGSGWGTAVALGDLDGDGDLDAVVANANNQPETVWVNDGAGSFTPHLTTPAFSAGFSGDVTLGDLDGDGDLDAVVASQEAAQTVWVNDGAGSFTPHPTTPAFGSESTRSTKVTLGDLDGDGDLDAVVANLFYLPSEPNDAETVWVNDGAGSFAPHPTTPAFGAAQSTFVTLGDLDGDGDLDAVVANFNDQAATVWINLDANTPPTAVADSYSVNEDQSLTVAAPGVLGNDTDPDASTTLTTVLVSGPAHAASFTLYADGSFNYTPVADFASPDSFIYQARDPRQADSAPVTVSITVIPVNDVPTVAVAGAGQCLSDRSGRINLVVADGDTLPANLTLGASSSNPQLVPVGNIIFGGTGANRTATIATPSGRTGSATLTLTVNDGSSSTTTTVTVSAGGNGRDTLNGTEEADILFGQNADDVLSGNGGNDLLCGGRGDDTLTGGAGADSFSGGPGANTLTDFNAGAGDTTDGT